MPFTWRHSVVGPLAFLVLAASSHAATAHDQSPDASEIESLVRDVLADAEQHPFLSEQPLIAGHDGEFFIASNDGSFRLGVSGFLQAQAVYRSRDAAPDEDGSRFGFEFRRLRLKFRGHVIDPGIRYVIGWSFDRDGGALELSDGYLAFDLRDDLELMVGRYRPEFIHEWNTSAKRQSLADRSLVAKAYGLDRSPGLQLIWEPQHNLVLSAALNDASGDFLGDERWLAVARAQAVLFGSSRSLRDLSSFRDADPVIALGAGGLYERHDPAAPGEPDVDEFRWTIDAVLETGGFSLSSAVLGRHARPDGEPDTDEIGLVIQAAAFILDRTELIARFEWADDDLAATDDLLTVTAGVAQYLDGHDLKLIADVGYGLEPVPDAFSSTSAGWAADAPGQDGQIVIRAQLQLVF
jgi:hypothetical protein